MKKLFMLIGILVLCSGCNSIVQDQTIIKEDFKLKTKTTTTTKVVDKSFTLGSKGLGEYYLVKVQGL